mmetsp:Transcript_16595/g.40540  ORF Transcript_16595/g.40540 Transcript_16595/m.40540 type:complete len:160 (+) Transcript_16595:373-852(+)
MPTCRRFLSVNSFCSISRYSSNDPSKVVTLPGLSPCRRSTCHSSSAQSWMSRSSWLTSTTPPSNLLIAMARASIVSMSRWLVGSSRSRMCGCRHASSANASLLFCPPDSVLIGRVARSPLSPKRPRYLRASSSESGSPTAACRLRMCMTASFSMSNISR